MRSAQELNSLALRTRRVWGEDSYSPIDIFAIVNGWKNKKITIIRFPMSKNLSGMCTVEGQDIIICINSTMSYGRQRFTLAHELYHVLYEENRKRVICSTNMNSKDNSEREADRFASYLLMPYDALQQYALDIEAWTIETIVEAEQFYQISHHAMLYRLATDRMIDWIDVERFKEYTVSKVAAKQGYSKDLYQATEQGKQYYTTGEYIRKVEQALEQDLISNGKREELLMDAYRADMVYDFDEGDELPDD